MVTRNGVFVRESSSEFTKRQRAKLAARRSGQKSLARRLQQTRDPKQVRALSGISVRPQDVTEAKKFQAFGSGGNLFAEGTKADIRIATSKKREATRNVNRQQGRTPSEVRSVERAKLLKETKQTEKALGRKFSLLDIGKNDKPTTADVFENIKVAKPTPPRKSFIIKSGEFVSSGITRLEENKFQEFERKSGNLKILKKIRKVTKKVFTKLEEKTRGAEFTKKDAIKTLLSKPFSGALELTGRFALRNSIEQVPLIVNKITTKPLTGSAKVAAGFLINRVGGKFVKIAAKSGLKPITKIPKLDVFIKGTNKLVGKTALAGFMGLYVADTIKTGAVEIKSTGKLSNTTADVFTDILLFGAGNKLGSKFSFKDKQLAESYKLFKNLPKKQQKKFIGRVEKFVKNNNVKKLKNTDIGLVTKLDTQQVSKVISGSRSGERLITAFEKGLFIVKKGRIPKKTGTFTAEFIGVRNAKQIVKGGKIESIRGFKATYKVKFNARTGKVERIGNPLKVESADPLEIRNAFKILRSKKIKKVPIKQSTRKILTKKEIKIQPTISEKLKLRFEVEKTEKIINVKEFERNIKKFLQLTKKGKLPKIKVGKDSLIDFTQIKPVKKAKVVKPKKSVSVLKPKKIDELVELQLIDGKLVVLQVKKVKPIIKTVSKKPVIKTKTVSVKDDKLKLIVLPKGEKKFKKPETKEVSKTIVKPVGKTIVIQDRKLILEPLPKLKVTPVSKIVSKTKPVTKVTPVSKSKSKVVLISKIAQKQEQKSRVVQVQKLRQKQSTRLLSTLKQKKIKIIPFFKLPKLKHKKFKGGKKVKPKIQFTKFTTTITRPEGKKRGRGLKFGDVELFTGAELR